MNVRCSNMPIFFRCRWVFVALFAYVSIALPERSREKCIFWVHGRNVDDKRGSSCLKLLLIVALVVELVVVVGSGGGEAVAAFRRKTNTPRRCELVDSQIFYLRIAHHLAASASSAPFTACARKTACRARCPGICPSFAFMRVVCRNVAVFVLRTMLALVASFCSILALL